MEQETLPIEVGHRKSVFITGGTGYIGKRLIEALLTKGFHTTALVRSGSQSKVPPGVNVVIADPFDAQSFQPYVPPGCIFIQLLGVSHPSPTKAPLFKEIDLRSVTNSVTAASRSMVAHFIYVSVAMEPSTVMQAYQEVRKQGEEACIRSGMNCTFIRPWYVVGPGHLWPLLLQPLFFIARFIPPIKNKALAFGLITIQQMITALINAVESEPVPLRIIEIPEIKNLS